MDILRLLDEIEDIIEESSTVPIINKILVEKGDILDVIKEIRIKLPHEIKQAEWIKEERQRILAEAQSESDTIVEEARLHIEEMIDENEITKKAQERAAEIITKAQNNAKEMRIGAGEYADKLLKKVQDDLDSVISTIEDNRIELKKLK